MAAAAALYKNWMGLADDEWGDATAKDLMNEGMPLSVSIFMATWVITYNVLHVVV